MLHNSITHILIHFRVYVIGSNQRTVPNFVVFLPQLLELFDVCPSCKIPGALVEIMKFGTMVQIQTTCNNVKCMQKNRTWNSQPTMPGTNISAGNLLLSFSILCGGGSASKFIQIFQHRGLSCISLSIFFRHQRVCIVLIM
jgi:hypothetical protein